MPHVGLPLCGGAKPGELSKLSHESQFNLVDLQCGVWAEGAFKFKGLVPPEEGIVHVEKSSCLGMWYAGESIPFQTFCKVRNGLLGSPRDLLAILTVRYGPFVVCLLRFPISDIGKFG